MDLKGEINNGDAGVETVAQVISISSIDDKTEFINSTSNSTGDKPATENDKEMESQMAEKKDDREFELKWVWNDACHSQKIGGLLPPGWKHYWHRSGITIYIHEATGVCSLTRPFKLSTQDETKFTDELIPITSIPCLNRKKNKGQGRTQLPQSDCPHTMKSVVPDCTSREEIRNKSTIVETDQLILPSISDQHINQDNVPSSTAEITKSNEGNSLMEDNKTEGELTTINLLDSVTIKVEQPDDNDFEGDHDEGHGMEVNENNTANSEDNGLTDGSKRRKLNENTEIPTESQNTSRKKRKKKFKEDKVGTPYLIPPDELREYCSHLFQFKHQKQFLKKIKPNAGMPLLHALHFCAEEELGSLPEFEFQHVIHNPRFTVWKCSIALNGCTCAKGYGNSKVEAKKNAARIVVRVLFPKVIVSDDNPLDNPINSHESLPNIFHSVGLRDEQIINLCLEIKEPTPIVMLDRYLYMKQGEEGLNFLSTKSTKLPNGVKQIQLRYNNRFMVTHDGPDDKIVLNVAAQMMLTNIHPKVKDFSEFIEMYGNTAMSKYFRSISK